MKYPWLKRFIAMGAVAFMVTGFTVACSSSGQQACAAEISAPQTLLFKGSSGGSSGGHTSSGGSKSSGSSSGSKSSSGSSGGSKSAPSKSTSKQPGATRSQDRASKTASNPKNYKPPSPTSAPSSKQASSIQKSMPKTLSSTSTTGYHSPVTNYTYMPAPRSYYYGGGYMMDAYDPFNPLNLYLLSSSYYYANHPTYVVDCSSGGDSDLAQPMTDAEKADLQSRMVTLPDGSIYINKPGEHLTADQVPTDLQTPTDAAVADTSDPVTTDTTGG
jgi:hypothetical protein